MFGEALGELPVQELAEIRVRKLVIQFQEVHRGSSLAIGSPNFRVGLTHQKERTRELRILGILVLPITQRLLGEADLMNDIAIDGVVSRANRFIP